jgi:two-component system, chemotaxis family, chemotaxis protein CheY
MVKVLIVDDDTAVRMATRLVLQSAGYEIIEAVNGMRIEGTIVEQKPDLVLTDMLMPDRDGVETVLSLRRRFPALRIIAMSGGGTRGDLDLGVARKLGVSATLAKPFDGDALVALIETVLAGPPPEKPKPA